MALPLAAIGQTQDGPGPGVRGGQPGIDLFPAPASVGASVGLSYFGPPPSDDNPSLVGPVQLLKSGVVDPIRGTITLPLYKGLLKGTNQVVWYILTDVSDPPRPSSSGNFSTKLNYAGPGARTGNFDANGTLIFDAGTVDSALIEFCFPDLLRIRFRLPWHVPGHPAIQIIVRSYASLMQGE